MSRDESSGRAYLSLITLTALLAGHAQSSAAEVTQAHDNADDAARASRVEEVVVTAQKRSERLQDVPAAITALSPEQLSALGVSDVSSLSRVAPSFSFTNPNGGGTEPRLIMRGLSTGGAMAPVVSVYVNETPLDFRIGDSGGQAMIDFFDLERIEVLRGPQGTILGSSSLAGAIRVVTAKPDTSSVKTLADVTLSTTDGGGTNYWTKGALNLPLTSNAAVRIVATHAEDSGWIDGVVPVSYETAAPGLPVRWRNANSSDSTSARVEFMWSPSDSLTIRPSVIYQETGLDGLGQYKAETGEFIRPQVTTEGASFKTTIGSLVIDKTFDRFMLTSASNVVTRRKNLLADFSHYAERFASSVGLPALAYPAPFYNTHDDDGYSQEIRATSIGADRLRWIVGAYYNYSKGREIQNWYSAAYAPAVGTDLLLTYDVPVKDEQIAGFGEATYSFFDDRFEVSAGARLYEVKSELAVNYSGPFGGQSTPQTKSDGSGVSPRVSATFKPNPHASYYATYSEGFRQGGPNPGIAQTDDPIADCSFFSLYKTSFSSDKSKNFEVGVKTQPLSGLSINLAAYQLNWSSFQSIVSSNCGSFVANVGDARNRGVELETQIRLIENLSIYGGASYNDGVITRVLPEVSNAGATVPGQRLINSPRFQSNVGAQAEFPLQNSSQLHARVNWQYSGETPTSYTNTAARYQRKAYNNLDASIGWQVGLWSLELFGRNLTNDEQIQQISAGLVGGPDLIPGRPRTYGVGVRYGFN